MTSPTPENGRRWYRFGPYIVDAPKRLIWRNGILVPLTAKAFEILLVLLQKRERVVEKQELLESVWPRTAVEENTLTRHISTLRKALEERPDDHAYILTVPGHGYQFVADVIELEARPEHLHHSVAPETAGDRHLETTLDEPAPAMTPGVTNARTSRLPYAVAIAALLAVVAIAIGLTSLGRDPGGSAGPRALRQFTFDSGVQNDPTWSPDGKRIAYASDRAGNSDIWVQPLDEPTPTQLTSWTAHDSQPDWSPDGHTVVFRSERDGGGLYLVDASGGEPRRLTTFGYRPRWSPDGQMILFSSSGHPGGTARFHVVALDGQPPAPLRSDLVADFSTLYVAWRPTGRSVSVWGNHRRDGWTFVTADVRNGPPAKSNIGPEIERAREENGLRLGKFVWSRSGRHIYFEGRAHETHSVWRIDVDPRSLAWIGTPERLTSGTTQDVDAALSADGRRLAFSAKSTRTRLWMFPFDAEQGRVTGDGQPVTTGGAGEQDADIPDDGSKLVYRTLRGGTQQLWERDVANGRERLLVRGDQWNRTRPRWSSDGTRLSYTRRRVTSNGTTDGSVVVFAVDRGEERELTPRGGPQIIPSDWSADGRWVLGGCPQPSTRRVGTCLIDATDVSGPRTMRLLINDPTHNQFEQRFSPDQRWISFIAVDGSDAGVSKVVVMPASGGPWQSVTDGSSYDDKPHWAPDGRTLYFVSPRDGALNVWGRRFDTTAGTPIGPGFQVTSFTGPRRMISTQLADMQIALTSNRLFLPITESQSEVWVLERVDR